MEQDKKLQLNYKVVINLASLLDVERQVVEMSDGTKQECVVIPIKANSIYVGVRNLNLKANVILKPNVYNGQTHYIQATWSGKSYAENMRMGLRNPIIGNLTPFFVADKGNKPKNKDIKVNDINNVLGIQ